MRRTLQTADLALDWLRERGVRFEASADWQGMYGWLRPPPPPRGSGMHSCRADGSARAESSAQPCDTGSPVARVAPSFGSVDFTGVDPLWPDKTSPAAARYAYTRAAVLARGRRCLDALWRRPESVVFVVSHSAFMRVGVVGWWFSNGDYRVFDFQGDEEVLEEGGKRRVVRQDEGTVAGGLGLSWTHRVELGSELPDGAAGDVVEQ